MARLKLGPMTIEERDGEHYAVSRIITHLGPDGATRKGPRPQTTRQKLCKMLEVIGRAEWVSLSDVARACRTMDADEIKTRLAQLVAEGKIEAQAVKRDGPGRPGTRYRLATPTEPEAWTASTSDRPATPSA